MTKEEEYKQIMELVNTQKLEERMRKCQMVFQEFGEENFYVSFSGGKDSMVMHELIDLACPGNTIPRVYADTGIEYEAIRSFVKELAEKDNRFVIIKPSVPIKQMLDKEGYPFKSKWHGRIHETFRSMGRECRHVKTYLGEMPAKSGAYIKGGHACPKILRYQFEEGALSFPISQKCCARLKKDPMHKWEKENKKPFKIIGILREEGGQRNTSQCLAFRNNKLFAFQPLAPLTKEWEDWFIRVHGIKLCKLYYPPYNFERTGCKGCPFNINIQRELDTLDKYFPKERAQCERIWKPVYDEYRRLGYRLRPLDEGRQMTIEELLQGDIDNV